MDNISGVLNTVIKSLREITDPVKGADVGRLPVMFGPDREDGDFTVPLGIIYAERFFSCVTPSLRYPLGISARAKDGQQPALELSRVAPAAAGEGNDIIPAWSADQAMTDTLFDALKLYKRPTPDVIRKYAGMDAAHFAAALVDIITSKGRGKLDGDSINWRCVYAGYIYLQTDEYLRDQTATFALVPQNPATHALAKIDLGEWERDAITKSAVIRFDDDTVIRITNTSRALSPAARMLNDIMLFFCKKSGSPSITISMRDLAELKGRSTSKAALAELQKETRKQIEELSAVCLKFKDKIDGEWVYVGELRLNGGTHIVARNKLIWNYNPDFYESAIKNAPMDFPRAFWKVDPRTNQFFFARYIAMNYRLNEGKPNRDKINIRTLIAQSPKLPTYDEVMNGNRNVRDRIIRKTFQDLDALPTLFYTVYTADGTQIDDPDYLDYADFINAYILVDYSDYPEHPERIQAQKRRSRRRKTPATQQKK